MLKVAVVGAGYIGQLHANVIAGSCQDAEVTAIVEPVEHKGKKFAKSVGARYYSGYDEMLENAAVDVVAICAPTFQHAEMTSKAFSRKKHVFCEKPLALTVTEAESMAESAREAGVKTIAGHVLRFWPVYVRAKEILDSGALGRSLFAYCERLLTVPTYTEGDWNRIERLGGGVALDVQIHDLDFLSWVLGYPSCVCSQGVFDEALGGWSHIVTQLNFPGECLGVVQAGWSFPESFPFTMGFRVVCEGGTIEWSFRAGRLLEQREQDSALVVYRKDGTAAREEVDRTDPFLLEWSYFIDCIRSDTPVERATFEDGAAALKIALATAKSATLGEAVTL